MSDSQRILAIFPHPDDATLFAAGTLARWVKEGHAVTAVCCTSGDLGTLRLDQTGTQVAARREAELRGAHEILGIQETVLLRLPDGGLMDGQALRRELVRCVRTYKPHRVLTLDPWARYEVHPDHELVARMAAEAAAFAAFPLLYPEQLSDEVRPHAPAEVWFMGILGRAPNCFVNIEETLRLKVRAALTFEATLGIVVSLSGADVDLESVSGLERKALSKHAEDWLRTTAAEVGEVVGLSAAEAFLVQPCRPGHFANLPQLFAEMLGRPAEEPVVL